MACFDPEEELDHDSQDKERFSSTYWEMIELFQRRDYVFSYLSSPATAEE
jgi:hypothetical protein